MPKAMSAALYAAELAAAERHLFDGSALMRRLIAAHGPCALAPEWRRSPYEALVRAVAHQQLNGRAAQTILNRFIALFPDSRFPMPKDVLAASEEDLRSAGLSRQKIAAVRDIAIKAEEGIVPMKRAQISSSGDDDIIRRLVQVRGVGQWTVEMLLIFTLGRLDVLPVDDFGVRAGYTRASRRESPVTPAELREIGRKWAPYRSVAAWYFWRAADG
ncbi:DNA-3-methyladenine glycosylase 2 [mine drainage metagenome]|uniref:DNA-3-methyladenine glycosylase 2 n=1 Tax=mine drainage metagenome TaxID=410659 RepID=A0A1J5R7E2_9ZZZZ